MILRLSTGWRLWFAVFALAGLLLSGPVSRGQHPLILVDHTSYPLFAQIPPEYLSAALALRFGFADRSVGVNVRDGFACLAQEMATAPNSCKTVKAGLAQETWTPLQTHTTFSGWPGLGLPNPMDGCVGSNGLWAGLVPCFTSWYTPRLGAFDAIGIFPDYTLSGWSDSMANFYTDRPPGPYGEYDAGALHTFETAIAPVRLVWFSPSVPKADVPAGSLQRLRDFATAARADALNHGSVFVDVYDILTHDWNGTPTVNGSGLPIQSFDWGGEVNGGHITYGSAKVRMAKLWLVALAQVAGWVPAGGSDTTPPTITASCTLADCTASFSDASGIASVTATYVVRDMAGNEHTVTVP